VDAPRAPDADPELGAPAGRRWARLLSTEEARFGGAGADGDAGAELYRAASA
jgi:hypothetical protein